MDPDVLGGGQALRTYPDVQVHEGTAHRGGHGLLGPSLNAARGTRARGQDVRRVPLQSITGICVMAWQVPPLVVLTTGTMTHRGVACVQQYAHSCLSSLIHLSPQMHWR